MRPPDAFHKFALGFAVWVGFSLLWSLDSNTTLTRIETFLQLFTLCLVVWDLCDSRQTIHTAVQSLVLGMWLASGSVFLNFARGIESNYGRFSASGADPNYMSVMVALGIPLAWYLALHSTHRALRIVNLLYVPAAIVVMGLTGSRGGLLAGFVAMAYVLSTIRRLPPAGFVALLIAIGAAVVGLSAVVPDTTLERLASIGDEIGEGDLNGREEIWLEAADAFFEHPVEGIGAGASRAVLPSAKVPHNVAITVGLELGIIGFALFAGLVAAALRWVRWLREPDRRMWLAAVGIWTIGALSLSLETRKLTWVLFSLLLGAAVAAYESRLAGGSEAGQLPVTMRAPVTGRSGTAPLR